LDRVILLPRSPDALQDSQASSNQLFAEENMAPIRDTIAAASANGSLANLCSSERPPYRCEPPLPSAEHAQPKHASTPPY